MAVNVTEKDKTLNEIIDWCKQLAAEGLRLASALLMQHDMDAYGVVRGQVNAYENTADHCGETVCTYYVTCPYCGYRLAVHSLPPREKCAD